MFSSKVGLTKGSEYPAHPDIPTIGFISCGVFTFILTAGYHDNDADVGDEDDEEEEEEHHDDDGDATIIITLSIAAFNGLAGSGAGVPSG